MSKFNMSKNQVSKPELDKDYRKYNFKEVSTGYTLEMAQEEASRCIRCKNTPCMNGCPVPVRIPEFIEQITLGDLEKAYEIITDRTNLPSICGRVCPQEVQCEGNCTRARNGDPVAIGMLERFVADYARENDLPLGKVAEAKGEKVAVVGAGPSGLSAGADLAKKGYEVTIFESLHEAGGIMTYGIPEYRLTKEMIAAEVKRFEDLGIKIKTNTTVGSNYSLDDLLNYGYDAIYLATGAAVPNFMGIKGENLNGVFAANEILMRVNLMNAYNFPAADTPVELGEKVLVVGGGNVAMDAARTSIRMGCNVTVTYRRSFEEMPARDEEVRHAQEEGVEFLNLYNPVEIIGTDGKVSRVKLERMELGEADHSGRRRPVPTGEYIENDYDSVIIAIGQSASFLTTEKNPDVNLDNWGQILINVDGKTTKDYVYAGGDAVTGPKTVVLAMKAGKIAAESIDVALRLKK